MRFVVTVTCYLLSSLGLLFTAIMVTEAIKSAKPNDLLILIVFCYAWLAHLVIGDMGLGIWWGYGVGLDMV
jgi:hypothetical protein